MNSPLCLGCICSIIFITTINAQSGSFKTESFSNGKAIPLQEPIISQEPGQPPKIIYGPSRESTGWVEARGGQSAIDEGIEWQGKKAYLTLTFDVVVVDTKTRKTLWSDSVGAFWNTITFVNLAKDNEAARWALVLGAKAHPDYQQRYDLETGKKLELVGGPVLPEGKTLVPRRVWKGSAGLVDTKRYLLITSADVWTALRTELFGAMPKDIPTALDIDFTKEVLLVCYAGKASNWAGISVELAVESDDRLVVRLERHTYQTLGKGKEEHPYGLIVLPRLTDKEYVLEYNRQNLIGGPPMWKEFIRLSLKK